MEGRGDARDANSHETHAGICASLAPMNPWWRSVAQPWCLLLALGMVMHFGACSVFKKSPTRKSAKSKSKAPTQGAVDLSEVEARGDGRWYVQGVLFSGVVQSKHAQGQKAAEISVMDGVRHGSNLQWHENGQKAIELSFQFGRPEGGGRQYFPDGALQKEVSYRNGTLVKMKEYLADGKQRLLPDWNADGSPKAAGEVPPAVASGNTGETPKPATQGTATVGAPAVSVVEVSFDKVEFRTAEGKPAPAFAPDARLWVKGQSHPHTGRVVGYFADGRRREEMNVREGLPHGLWVEWYPDGKPQFEFEYEAGVMKRYQAWGPDGKSTGSGSAFGKAPVAPRN